MRRNRRRLLRGAVSLALSAATLWAVAAAAPARSMSEAAQKLGEGELPISLLRFEQAEGLQSGLSLGTALVLYMAPLLLTGQSAAVEADAAEPAEAEAPEEPVSEERPEAEQEQGPEQQVPAVPGEPIIVRDNGVRPTTLRPAGESGYLVRGSVYVRNASAASLTDEQLSGGFSARLSADAPQVLILHTHGCEAYTMPEGEEYEPSDDHRTLDESMNVLRVGDEIAAVLSEAGIGVVHDRTLHDYPSYSGAYNRSLATAERCLAEHPSISFILDVHRDAVTDENGNQYKLICAEEPSAAQLEFVIGSDGGGLAHDGWRDNLRLACAVQETLLRDHPTLMRPIIIRSSRYNQQLTPGSLLLEVGTAGNSLEEALTAARLFARGFAETIREG